MNRFFLKLAQRFGLDDAKQVESKIMERAKMQVRNTLMGWQAAGVNRLNQAWSTHSNSIDSDLRRDLPAMVARSRDIGKNNDYGVQFLRMLKNNVLGEYGIALKMKAAEPMYGPNPGKPDIVANRRIEEEWFNWSKRGNCTVDRKMSKCDAERVSLESVAKDGEILIRKHWGFDNDHNFAIQIIQSDFLDVEHNVELPDGREIRMGIEFNQWREPIAYHLFRRHPNDNLYTDSVRLLSDRYERVPAEDMIHAFVPVDPHQSRGIPWMATPAPRMHMVGKYEDSEAVAARVSSSKMAFLKPLTADVEYKGETIDGGISMDADPGSIERLPYNMDIQTLDWNHPNSSYAVFMKTALRGIASGLGVSYNTLGNDMESVNFASGRLGLDAERETWKAIQRWFIEAILNEIFIDWLEVQLITQKIPLPLAKFDKFNSPDWRPRRWGYVNPVDEVKAKIEEVRAGFNSVTGVLAERGLDRDEVFDELAADMKAAEARGIKLPAIEEGTDMESIETEQKPAAKPDKPEPKPTKEESE